MGVVHKPAGDAGKPYQTAKKPESLPPRQPRAIVNKVFDRYFSNDNRLTSPPLNSNSVFLGASLAPHNATIQARFHLRLRSNTFHVHDRQHTV